MAGRRSLFSSWLVSYVSILAIPLLISGSVFWISSKMVSEEIDRSNTVLLEQIRQEIDNQLRDLVSLGSQIALNTDLRSLILSDPPLTPEQRYRIVELIKEFGILSAVSSYIDSFYVYIPAHRAGIGSTSFYTEEFLYSLFHDSAEFPFSEWKSRIGGCRSPTFLSVPRSGRQTIAYALPLPVDSALEPKATLVVLVSLSRLKETIGSFRQAKEGTVILTDGEKPILATDDGAYAALATLKLEKTSGRAKASLGGEPQIMSWIQSEVTGWNYLVLTPAKSYGKVTRLLGILMGSSILVCVILGFAASWFFSRRSYAQMKDLTASVSAYLGIEESGRLINEFAFIREAAQTAANEKRQIAEQLKAKETELRRTLLTQVLRGGMRSIDVQGDIFGDLVHGSAEGGWAVLYFVLDEPEDGSFVQDPAVSAFIARNGIEESAGGELPCIAVELDDGIALSLNTGHLGFDQKALTHLADRLRNTLSGVFGIRSVVSVSEVHEAPTELADAYREASSAMEYRVLLGEGAVAAYRDFRDQASAYWFPPELEAKLSNTVKAGDKKAALSIYDMVIRENFSDRMVTSSHARCLMMDMAACLLKLLNDLGDSASAGGFAPTDPVETVLQCVTVDEMSSSLRALIEATAERIALFKKDQGSRLMDEIQRYAGDRYGDTNLSVASIAEHFRLSPNYLSHLFREKTGAFLHDHITRIRVERAKEMMALGKRSIKEIARECGFSNSNNFIRVFKRIEGITPGQFHAGQAGVR